MILPQIAHSLHKQSSDIPFVLELSFKTHWFPRFVELDAAVTQNKAEMPSAQTPKLGTRRGDVQGSMPLTGLMTARPIKLTKIPSMNSL
jgi:hypothetical protein